MNKHTPAGELKRRKEDYNLIRGHAYYVDDLRSTPGRPPALSMVVVRSIYAHATITRINLDAARSLPGVVAALQGEELVSGMPTIEAMSLPGLKKPQRRPLATGKARYMGDPIAIILAENPYIAADAVDLVEVDYEPLPAVVDPERALEANAPLLYDEFGTNVAFSNEAGGGDIEAAFKNADRVTHLRIANQRLAPSSLEPRACLFDFDPTSGELSAWLSSQAVFRARDVLSRFLNLDRSRIKVHNAEVGGAFGAKNNFLGEEIIAALLAIKYERPIKWIENRIENLQAQSQGRGLISYVEAAFQSDGRLLGLKVRSIADLGAFLAHATALVPVRVASLLCGPYQVQAIQSELTGVFTNKATTAPYRGAGRPEAAYIVERIMDRIAHELKLDPAEVRRRNFIAPQDFPHTSATGLHYDSGNYPAVLDHALALADYAGWREKQRASREAASPRLLGIGLSTFIEDSGENEAGRGKTPREAATVRIRHDGTILVQSGVSHNGQGHFTAFTQIAAHTLNVPDSRVEVRMNDAALPGFSIGTFASRTTQGAASAVLLAAQAVKAKALRLAAQTLEAAPDDLLMENGRVTVRGTPARVVELAELARMVEAQPDLIEHEPPNPANGAPIEGLAAWRDFTAPGPAYSFGAHLALVEVDTETGDVHVLKYVAVDDCGRVLNHTLAEGQIHGSIAQGISQALYEEVLYNEEGQLLSGTLMDYALPIAAQIPSITTAFVETPSPTNPLGAKGVGEAGCLGAPPAIVNAVLDALSPLGIDAVDMPLTPEKVWTLVQAKHNT
jgi:aerobic carbon-monoxide dehydrogenase large subunit